MAIADAALAVRTLTAAERTEYDERGFVVIPDVFPAADLAALDAEIERLLTRPDSQTVRAGWIHQLGLRSEVTRAFTQDERILTLIQDIVHPGIAIFSAKLAAKLPNNPEICHWHQDDAYYVRHSDSSTRMSVWVPFQDSDERNGCLWIVPGSHRWGLKEHHNEDYGQCRYAMDPKEIDLSKAIPVQVKVGAAVLFHAQTWHSSKGNETNRVRRAFIVSYQEATAASGNGAQWKVLRPAA
jgi:ectoine hydroxylase-related dioxygenase (phytanoyl-CoA dioxygenase family)